MWLRAWHRLERWFIYYTIRLFRIRSTTEHIARGFAAGLIVNFFPTFGFGVLVSGIALGVFNDLVLSWVRRQAIDMRWNVVIGGQLCSKSFRDYRST
jgi:uncharacterized protein (DUF2062 family)